MRQAEGYKAGLYLSTSAWSIISKEDNKMKCKTHAVPHFGENWPNKTFLIDLSLQGHIAFRLVLENPQVSTWVDSFTHNFLKIGWAGVSWLTVPAFILFRTVPSQAFISEHPLCPHWLHCKYLFSILKQPLLNIFFLKKYKDVGVLELWLANWDLLTRDFTEPRLRSEGRHWIQCEGIQRSSCQN